MEILSVTPGFSKGIKTSSQRSSEGSFRQTSRPNRRSRRWKTRQPMICPSRRRSPIAAPTIDNTVHPALVPCPGGGNHQKILDFKYSHTRGKSDKLMGSPHLAQGYLTRQLRILESLGSSSTTLTLEDITIHPSPVQCGSERPLNPPQVLKASVVTVEVELWVAGWSRDSNVFRLSQ